MEVVRVRFGMLERLEDIFAERVFLDAEVQGRTFGRARHAEVCVTSFGAREEEEVGYAERTAHGSVVAEFVASAFLHPVSTAHEPTRVNE